MRLLITFILGAALAWPQIIVLPKKKAAACSTKAANTVSAGDGAALPTLGRYSGNWYFASTFTAGSSFTVCAISANLAAVGSPTQTITASIWSDNSGTPDAQVGTASATVDASGLSGSQTTVQFTGVSASLTSGTTYWVVLGVGANNSSNYINWYTNETDTSTRIKSGTSVPAWTNFSLSGHAKYILWQ